MLQTIVKIFETYIALVIQVGEMESQSWIMSKRQIQDNKKVRVFYSHFFIIQQKLVVLL